MGGVVGQLPHLPLQCSSRKVIFRAWRVKFFVYKGIWVTVTSSISVTVTSSI